MYGGCEHCEREAIVADNLEKARIKFSTWFEDTHSERLEIVSDFNGMDEPLSFKCKIHRTTEEFLPTRMYHGPGVGWACSSCASESIGRASRLDPIILMEELTAESPNGISIVKVYFDKERGSTRVIIKCDAHGQQNPISKAQFQDSRHKCPQCSRDNLGYAGNRLQFLIDNNLKGDPCSVAVMEIEAFGITALKVGITKRTLKVRYKEALKTIFYEVKLLEIDALVLENRIKGSFSDSKDDRIKNKGMRDGKRWVGDTELFWFNCKEPIVAYIENYISALESDTIDYEKELGQMIVPILTPQNIEFEPGNFPGPIPVIGINPDTNEVIHRCASMAEAERLGFDNISLVASDKYNRFLSGGIRWIKETEYDPENISPLEIPHAKPVYCIERNQHFRSTAEAEKILRDLDFEVSASHITSVINGHRAKSGGFTWQFSIKTTKEILDQNPQDFINFQPKTNPNRAKKVRLTSLQKPEEQHIFSSLNKASKLIDCNPRKLSEAIKNNSTIKGYKAEIVNNKQS